MMLVSGVNVTSGERLNFGYVSTHVELEKIVSKVVTSKISSRGVLG